MSVERTRPPRATVSNLKKRSMTQPSESHLNSFDDSCSKSALLRLQQISTVVNKSRSSRRIASSWKWTSCRSASSVWGARGPGFKFRRPDQINIGNLSLNENKGFVTQPSCPRAIQPTRPPSRRTDPVASGCRTITVRSTPRGGAVVITDWLLISPNAEPNGRSAACRRKPRTLTPANCYCSVGIAAPEALASQMLLITQFRS